MKALLMEEYKKLNFTDVPDPKIADPHDILVRVKAVSICGSDVHGLTVLPAAGSRLSLWATRPPGKLLKQAPP